MKLFTFLVGMVTAIIVRSVCLASLRDHEFAQRLLKTVRVLVVVGAIVTLSTGYFYTSRMLIVMGYVVLAVTWGISHD